mmetsp:Transcript_2313/g.4965  ORF Transcript_2313/g.4965 Transcript_2313/m.4965 type:complete len:242 (-) Transcript_2313:61-786(-)
MSGYSSVSNLRTRHLGPSLEATSSITGTISWQGPHHLAKQSKIMGVSRSVSSISSSSPVTKRHPAPWSEASPKLTVSPSVARSSPNSAILVLSSTRVSMTESSTSDTRTIGPPVLALTASSADFAFPTFKCASKLLSGDATVRRTVPDGIIAVLMEAEERSQVASRITDLSGRMLMKRAGPGTEAERRLKKDSTLNVLAMHTGRRLLETRGRKYGDTSATFNGVCAKRPTQKRKGVLVTIS